METIKIPPKSEINVESCATTTRDGHMITAKTLAKILAELPKPPTVLAMDFEIISNQFLPNNTIIVSKDLADRMGWQPVKSDKKERTESPKKKKGEHRSGPFAQKDFV